MLFLFWCLGYSVNPITTTPQLLLTQKEKLNVDTGLYVGVTRTSPLNVCFFALKKDLLFDQRLKLILTNVSKAGLTSSSQFPICLTVIVFTGYAPHFVLHTVLPAPNLFWGIISIFCMLVFIYAHIFNNSFFFFYSK